MKRLVLGLAVVLAACPALSKPRMYIAFQWHLHQPIYWPYESVKTTADTGKYGFNLIQVFTDRIGPYTAWPIDAIQAGKDAGLGSLGAQVSFSGSLMENLNALAAAGVAFSGWNNRWAEAASWKTVKGNPRLDLVRFGYHHPLMALVSPASIRWQMALHSWALEHWIGVETGKSKGLFPPENGFAEEMIPVLAAAGVEWVFVDNIHFDRAHVDYPYAKGSNLYPPNASDQRNTAATSWVALNGIWAPSKVSAPWGYQPHRIAYTDPATGAVTQLIAVPTARYEGNEDGKGGFGALLYDKVFSQYEDRNTDDNHPMLIVLHHDGDNYGGGTESYYHGNFSAFIDWLKANPDRFVCTTVQDYLDQFPPAEDDVIHVEPGSWSGANNGDPEFSKWNGDPDASGYSPDRNSWAVMVAAANRIETAAANRPEPSVADVVAGTGSDIAKAWHFFLNGETSCYWYWDNAEGGKWDAHPTRAANLALESVEPILAGTFEDKVPPSIYPPQREPYNPGGVEWDEGKPMPSDFTVWTYIDDVSGVVSATLYWRVDADGAVTQENRVYATPGYQALPMVGTSEPAKTDPPPKVKAARYDATISGLHDVLVDYYVEAKDGKGNVGRSPIRHVFIGKKTGTGPGGPWSPAKPCVEDKITIPAGKAGFLHWGVNGWMKPIEAYWPAGSKAWTDNIAVETPLVQSGEAWSVTLGPFLDPSQPVTEVNFVFHWADGSWDKDQAIPIAAECAAVFEPAADGGPEPVAETPPEPLADAAQEGAPEAAALDVSVDPGSIPEPVPDSGGEPTGFGDSGKTDVQPARGNSSGCRAGGSGLVLWGWIFGLASAALAIRMRRH